MTQVGQWVSISGPGTEMLSFLWGCFTFTECTGSGSLPESKPNKKAEHRQKIDQALKALSSHGGSQVTVLLGCTSLSQFEVNFFHLQQKTGSSQTNDQGKSSCYV